MGYELSYSDEVDFFFNEDLSMLESLEMWKHLLRKSSDTEWSRLKREARCATGNRAGGERFPKNSRSAGLS